jgi:pimeloyl-ACP methyl ester carboxylesterase
MDAIRDHFDQIPRVMAAVGYSPASDRGQVDAWSRRQVQAPREIFWADMKACALHDLRARLAEVTCPATVLSAADDRLTPPSVQEKLARGLGRADLESVPRAGHFLAWERPELVATLILEGAGGGVR